MDKIQHTFFKLAKKKKDKNKINPVYPIAVGGAAVVAGASFSYRKPVGMHYVKMPRSEVSKFLKKLKPGDILTTGAYNPGNANPYQILLNRKSPQYHSAVYVGKGLQVDMLPYMKKPRGTADVLLIRDFKNTETFLAHRPKLTEKERKKFVHDIKINQKKYIYSKKDSTVGYIKNKIERKLPTNTIIKVLPKKLGDKMLGCKGKFCSNLASEHLSQKMFKVHKTVAMPIDYHDPKYFKFVGELRKKTRIPHMAASNKSLLKYIAKPALAVGAGVAVADILGVI